MSIRGKIFTAVIRMQNVNPVIHPEMEHKMKDMSRRYSHTKEGKKYLLRCKKTEKGTKYQCLKKKGAVSSGKVIYYIHGGCYISGLTYNYRDFCKQFFKIDEGIEIVLLDYSLSPDYKYPVQFNEAYDVWCELTENKNVDPKDIIVGGDSSGGNLLLALMLYIRDKGMKMPGGIFLLSPWTDMTASGNSYKENYRKDAEIGDKKGEFNEKTRKQLLSSYLFEYIGDHNRHDPYISPAFGDYHNFPPMMIFAGEDEMLLDDSISVYDRSVNAGVKAEIEICKGMFHSYPLYMDYMPESKKSCKRLRAFVSDIFFGKSE